MSNGPIYIYIYHVFFHGNVHECVYMYVQQSFVKPPSYLMRPSILWTWVFDVGTFSQVIITCGYIELVFNWAGCLQGWWHPFSETNPLLTQ